MKKIPQEIEALLKKPVIKEDKILDVIKKEVDKLDRGDLKAKYLKDIADLFRNREKSSAHYITAQQKQVDRLKKSSRYSEGGNQELGEAQKVLKSYQNVEKATKSLIPHINNLAIHYEKERVSPTIEEKPSYQKATQHHKSKSGMSSLETKINRVKQKSTEPMSVTKQQQNTKDNRFR